MSSGDVAGGAPRFSIRSTLTARATRPPSTRSST
jgi:hypothetical protein